PKVTGRMLNKVLGKIHFFFSFIFINGVFMPMFLQGLAGLSRRTYDPTQYAHGAGVQPLNVFISWSAWMLAVAQLPFIINFFWSIWKGKKVENDNPWDATTLEWATPTPPPHGNFDHPPEVYRDPYEYSVPGKSSDFLPQFVKEGA